MSSLHPHGIKKQRQLHHLSPLFQPLTTMQPACSSTPISSNAHKPSAFSCAKSRGDVSTKHIQHAPQTTAVQHSERFSSGAERTHAVVEHVLQQLAGGVSRCLLLRLPGKQHCWRHCKLTCMETMRYVAI